MALREKGLREPLPFAPYAGWELFNAPTLEEGLDAAANRWRGSERSWSEGDGDALRLALRGRDPFNDAATGTAFVDLAQTIYLAVVSGAWLLITDSVPVIWAVAIAFVLSGLGSYVLLNRQREAFAQRVDERARRMSVKFEEMKSKEDVD